MCGLQPSWAPEALCSLACCHLSWDLGAAVATGTGCSESWPHSFPFHHDQRELLPHRAVMETKVVRRRCRLGASTTETDFLGSPSLRSRCQLGWFLPGPISSARWWPVGTVFCPYTSVLTASSCKHTPHSIGRGLTQLPFQRPYLDSSHIVSCCQGLGLPPVGSGGDGIQSFRRGAAGRPRAGPSADGARLGKMGSSKVSSEGRVRPGPGQRRCSQPFEGSGGPWRGVEVC